MHPSYGNKGKFEDENLMDSKVITKSVKFIHKMTVCMVLVVNNVALLSRVNNSYYYGILV